MEKGLGVLDTIKTNPTYVGTLLSTNKKFKFRPYTAGEEQTLLLAKESNDVDIILTNTKEVIRTCTFDEIDPDALASFDIEWLLLQLRSKAVGEEIEITIPCKGEECKKTNDTTINIDDIQKPVIEKDGNVIQLNDEVVVVMKYPGFDVLNSLGEDIDIFKVIGDLVAQVVVGDKVIEVSELNPEEATRFIKGMNSKTIKKLTDFIKNVPAIEHKIKVKCIHCGYESEYKFKGINNFFV